MTCGGKLSLRLKVGYLELHLTLSVSVQLSLILILFFTLNHLYLIKEINLTKTKSNFIEDTVLKHMS